MSFGLFVFEQDFFEMGIADIFIIEREFLILHQLFIVSKIFFFLDSQAI